MKHAILVVAYFLFALCVYAETNNEAPGISIVGSPQQQLPDIRRVTRALDLAKAALGHRPLHHIHIVLICADKANGRTQGIAEKTPVRVVHLTSADPPTYHVFIVGGANDDRLAWASVAVLSREWGLPLEKRQIDEIAHRVRLGLSGVVSADELKKAD